MDMSLFLTIVGLLATFVFGFLSIDLFKRKRYPGKITFVKQSSIGLFDSFVKNFKEISILFENKPIKDNLIYLKGSFINLGDIDIEGDRIEEPITITLPDSFSWVNCRITNKSKNLICTSKVEDSQNIKHDFKLFRKGEFFQIEALVEAAHNIDDDAHIFDLLKVTHRIPQTQKITLIPLLSEHQIKNKKGKLIKLMGATLVQLLIPFLVILFFLVFFKSADLYYKTVDRGIIMEYQVSAKRDGVIELTNIETDEEVVISIAEFQNKDKYIPFIPTKTIWQKLKERWELIPIMVSFTMLIVIWEYWEIRKSNKINQILNSSE